MGYVAIEGWCVLCVGCIMLSGDQSLYVWCGMEYEISV